MTQNTSNVRRRTVLRAAVAGTSTVVGLGLTGTAGADHVGVGSCAKISHSVQSYGRGCLGDDPGPYFQYGEEGSIMKECTADGEEKVLFANPKGQGWIPHFCVEPC